MTADALLHGRARDRDAERRDRDRACAGCRGIRDPDARPIRHRPDRARARQGSLDPVIGREDEIEQTIEILSRRTKNNPVLVGEAGVGKTAIVEGLAQAIVAERRARAAARQARHLARPARDAGGHPLPRRLRGAPDRDDGRGRRPRGRAHPVHRRGAHRRRRGWRRRGLHGCRQHPQAATRARRPAPRRRDHPQGVPRHREGPRARAAVPAGARRRAEHRGRRADPARVCARHTRSTTASPSRTTRCAPPSS